MALTLYTGLRRGDIVTLGRHHICEGVIALRMEKTRMQVTIPLRPERASIIH